MTRITSNVLIDHLGKERSATREVLWIVGFSLLTGLLAQLEFRLPFTPVPLTGQTFGVLLAGAVLGWRRGFLSQALYLAEGAAGLPVFAGGAASYIHLVGPTGGYLWSYPLAAGVIGWLVERGASRKTWRLAIALVLSDALILITGTLWLRLFFRVSYRDAWLLGFYPFVIGDFLKIALVGISLPRVLKHHGRGE
jgi:biotin transport system substrate-specific component